MSEDCCAQCRLIDEFELLLNRRADAYEAEQLHDRNERGWAVIGLPHGAIADDANGAMMMRLTEREAVEAARAMTALVERQLACA